MDGVKKLFSALFPEGQRKLIVNIIIMVIGLVIWKVTGKIDDTIIELLLGVGGIFTVGNIGEHFANAKTPSVAPGIVSRPTLPAPPVTSVSKEIEDMKKGMQLLAQSIGNTNKNVETLMGVVNTRLDAEKE